MQKLVFVNSNLRHPKLSGREEKHGFYTYESPEVNNLLSDGWTVKNITVVSHTNNSTNSGFCFAVLLEKN